jgi:hypothetical protein
MPLNREPGRAGFQLPQRGNFQPAQNQGQRNPPQDNALIQALFQQEATNTGQAVQNYQGGGLEFGDLASIQTKDLMDALHKTEGGVDPQAMRSLRGLIEGRNTDDAARGPGPRQNVAAGKTSAEASQSKSWNPLQSIIDALGGN